MKLIPAALLLGLLGIPACGGDHGRLEGSWIFTAFEFNRPCTEELQLEYGQFVSTVSCLLKEGSYGQRVTIGQYTERETQVTATPTQSSCANETRTPVTWYVLVTRDRLEKTVGNVTATYTRGTADLKGVKVTGCFDAELKVFDPAPIVNLR